MNVLFVTPELSPLAKVGGLADVVASLPRALRRLGHRVNILLPSYGSVADARGELLPSGRRDLGFDVDFDGRRRRCGLFRTKAHGVSVFLLENADYFGGRHVYGDEGGDYPDNAFRFGFFSRAAIGAIQTLGLAPDVVHLHDWQTALVPLYMRLVAPGRRQPFVLTIHNLAYQGVFLREWLDRLGLPEDWFRIDGLEFYGKLNFLKGGLATAHVLTTVSPTYAREIQTPEHGCGLEGVLAARARAGELEGIRNGIEASDWSPGRDRALIAPFTATRLSGKRENKRALQKELGLSVSESTPLVGMIGRLDRQKGFDLALEAAPALLESGCQLVVLGSGRPEALGAFRALSGRFPERLAVEKGFRDELGRRIYAGSDLFLMPSRYEPCGLGQLIAMRYGTLPLVRATGGLRDTVRDLDEDPETGNGFVFQEFDRDALLAALGRAVARYRGDGREWRRVVARVMREDSSWSESARRYEAVYRKVIERARSL